MRFVRLLLRLLGGLLGVVLLLVLGLVAFVFFATRPETSGRLEARGLRGEVTVTRDARGIPHIEAKASDADALFALGYVHAQDRLWQMEFQRRIGAGRLSEVLGPAALEQDKFLRTWGFYRAAEAALPALSARSRGLLSAYTAGVNAAIARDKLPLEFRVLRFRPERWTDVDSLVWQKLMAFDLAGTWQDELTAQEVVDKRGAAALDVLLPPYPAGAPTILSERDLAQEAQARPATRAATAALHPDTRRALQAQLRVAASLGFQDAPDKGSNNWVVSGRFTESGKPLLADDPHLGLSAPMLWYLAELKGPTLHVVGATIPGLPGVVIGRNERIAWGVTNTAPDVQDLFVEPEGAKLTERVEVIKVKGQPDVRLTVQESAHGPIISGAGGTTRERVALRWTALDPGDTTMDAFIGINYARDWRSFREALRSFVAPMQNFVYADVDGDIGYIAPGRVPIRAAGDGRLPSPGDGSREWTGFVPFDELPQVHNPPEGLIVTANNKAVPDAYPHLLTQSANWAEPYRARRILELLGNRQGLTVRDMSAIQYDTRSLLWEETKPLLAGLAGANDREKAALAALRAWDGRQTTDSVASTIFAALYGELTRLPNDELGRDGHWNTPAFVLGQLRANGPYCADAKAGVPDCPALLARAFTAAVEGLRARLGDDVNSWRWGRLHRTASDHGAFGGVDALKWIWNRSVESPGGLFTVNVGSYDLDTYAHDHAASYRQVVDLADPDASRFVGTLGQSGNPLSGHYADQQGLWQRGESLPMSTKPGDWGQTSVLTLAPTR